MPSLNVTLYNYLSLSMCVSIYLPVYPSIGLFIIFFSVYLAIHVFSNQPIYLHVYFLSIYIFVYFLFIYLLPFFWASKNGRQSYLVFAQGGVWLHSLVVLPPLPLSLSSWFYFSFTWRPCCVSPSLWPSHSFYLFLYLSYFISLLPVPLSSSFTKLCLFLS